MSGEAEILLCQPGPSKGCSACCGLFNHRDISRGSLEAFLGGGGERIARPADEETEESLLRVNYNTIRDAGSHICPFQGFIAAGRPGCLIHPESVPANRRDRSLFGENICGSFLCPAHSILSNEEKEILIRNTGDWYSYTVAIVDPESFQWILELIRGEMPGTEEGSALFSKVLTACLLIHASYMCEYSGPIFFYSLGEYNLGKKPFSLASGSDMVRVEQEKIRITARIMNRNCMNV